MDAKEIRTGRIYANSRMGIRSSVLCSQVSNRRKDDMTKTQVADIELLTREEDSAIGVYKVPSHYLHVVENMISIEGGEFRVVPRENDEYRRLDFLLRRKRL